MKKRNILALILALVMAFSLAACTTPAEPVAEEAPAEETPAATEEAAEEGAVDPSEILIGYATKSSSSPFWVENIKGAEQAAADLGIQIEIVGPPVENDVVGQIAVLEDLITKGADGIAVAPCDSVGVVDVVNKALDAGLPVIAVGDLIEGAPVTSTVTTDNYNAGWTAAEFIGEEIGGEGKVIIINGMLSQAGGAGRRDGFVDYMTETYGEAVEVLEVTGDWDDQKALSGFEALYAANTDMVAGYAAWDGATLVMHKALEEAGRDDVVLCGFDCYDTALNLMNSGDPMFKGDIAQNPANMGYLAVETAYNAIMGESVESYIDTGATLVTAENVVDYADSMGVVLE